MITTEQIHRTTRSAGLLYLAMSLLAMLGYFYLHGRFFVSGDPAATARSILEHTRLYRMSILVDLAVEVLFILVVVSLYRLFRDVDRHLALVMVALVGTGIAAQFGGLALNAAPLFLLTGADHLSAFSRPQLEALSFAALRLHGKQGQLLTSLWGLWLFPFAALVLRCGFLPRFLGVLLYVSGAAYVVSCAVGIGFPEYVPAVSRVAMPLYFGEFIVVLWMAFVGARSRPVA